MGEGKGEVFQCLKEKEREMRDGFSSFFLSREEREKRKRKMGFSSFSREERDIVRSKMGFLPSLPQRRKREEEEERDMVRLKICFLLSLAKNRR